MVMFLSDKVDVKTRSAVSNRGPTQSQGQLAGRLKNRLCVPLVQE